MKMKKGGITTIYYKTAPIPLQIQTPYAGAVSVESASLEGSRIVLYRESMHKGQVDNVVIDFLRNDTDGTSMLVKVHSVHQHDFGCGLSFQILVQESLF